MPRKTIVSARKRCKKEARPRPTGLAQRALKALRALFIAPIRAYQRYISPMFPPSCRYYPSCSQYAIEAIETHGVWIGMGLGIWRIVRCNPFSKGGYDPVPPKRRR